MPPHSFSLGLVGLKKLFLTGSLAGIQAKHAERLRLILAQLHQARIVEDMQIQTLALHELKGERKKTWAVTVQVNWRVTFRFENEEAEVVDYEDYH
jgi:proteic killer suppression protein